MFIFIFWKAHTHTHTNNYNKKTLEQFTSDFYFYLSALYLILLRKVLMLRILAVQNKTLQQHLYDS